MLVPNSIDTRFPSEYDTDFIIVTEGVSVASVAPCTDAASVCIHNPGYHSSLLRVATSRSVLLENLYVAVPSTPSASLSNPSCSTNPGADTDTDILPTEDNNVSVGGVA